jgi:hypothetical protein
MKSEQPEVTLVVCINNAGYAAALERRKIYQVLPDSSAAQHRLLRIIDESGEDYLYPEQYFVLVSLPPSIQEAVLQAA